jgi:hypothetical protein
MNYIYLGNTNPKSIHTDSWGRDNRKDLLPVLLQKSLFQDQMVRKVSIIVTFISSIIVVKMITIGFLRNCGLRKIKNRLKITKSFECV